jgi:hypothetical protein
MINDFFEEQVFFTTTRISVQGINEIGSSIGTGFIVNVTLKDNTNRRALFLVSNKHVFKDPKGIISFSLNKSKADNTVDLGNLDTYLATDFSSDYYEHPDPEVDLACLNVTGVSIPPKNSFIKFIQEEMISKFDEPRLFPGADVWFVGYPENRYDVTNNLPLLRRGYISSLPKVRFNNRDQFIIDAQVFQGSSGSAVFAPIDGNYKLIGIVTATMIKHGKLQSINTLHQDIGVVQTLGLGIVIKSTKLIELLDIARKKTEEKFRI